MLPVGLDNNHWALGVIRPSRLELLLYDSAQPWRTDEREKHLQDFVRTLSKWLDQYYVRSTPGPAPLGQLPWKVQLRGERQRGGDECGIIAGWTAFCIARGIEPAAVASISMEAARAEMAAVIINRGFTGGLARW